MRSSPSLIRLLVNWYLSLGLIKKLVYPLLGASFYMASVLMVVALYWLKSDLGYDIFKNGGWHAFSACIAQEIRI